MQALFGAMMAMMPQQTQQMVIIPPSAFSSQRPTPPPCARLVMDSGNLTKYHLINDKTLFSSFNASDESIPIMVANKGIEWSSGGGTCDMLAMRDGCVLGRLLLPNCKYVPPDRFAVNLVSVQRAWADNIQI